MAEKMTTTEKKNELVKSLGLFLTGDMTGIDQNLIDRVKYTVTNYKPAKVSIKTLEDLMTEVSNAIKSAVQEVQNKSKGKKKTLTPVPVEGLKRPGSKKSAPAPQPKDEEEETYETEPEEETPKPAKAGKTTSKPAPKSTAKKESKYNMESCFPASIDDEELGTLVKVPDKFHDYKELVDYIENGGELYFATYWTPRLLKQFSYDRTWEVPCPSSFPHNLDLLVSLLVCENVERVWCMSRYTEAMMNFEGKSLKPIKDLDPVTGEKCSIRVMNGMEFEIYMKEEDVEE